MMCGVRRILTLLSGLPLIVLIALALPGTAAAETPFRLADRVTDRAGVLDPAGRARVTDAVTRLRADTGYDLFVVYVRTFDGRDGQEWADEAAKASQLGAEDVVLAVATDDRTYGLSVADGFPVDESTVDRVRTRDVEPKLAANDWAGAAVAAAQGLGGGGGSDGWVPTGLLVGGAAAVAGGAYLVSRRRRRRAGSQEKPDETQTADPYPGVSTDDLAGRAGVALIAVDDAVRNSEQELAAARAHFGDEAVAGFDAALEASRTEMLAAFEINQRLDESEEAGRPTGSTTLDEPTRRGMCAEILRLAESADTRLDDQVEAFDRLRGLEADAAGYVEGLARRLDTVGGRLPAAEAVWTAASGRFAVPALEPVAGHLEHARTLLAEAGTEVAEARTELGTPAHAVVSGRAAEDALTEAETLLDGIGRRVAELDEATTKLPAARAEVAQDLAEARALAGAGAGVGSDTAAAVARAEAALASADDAARAIPPDPMAALRLLDEAGGALDAAIAAARAAGERARRAATALEQALLTARASVAAAEDFVATRRGAVGSAARTRLAEARRLLTAASGAVDGAAGGGVGAAGASAAGASAADPEAALESARQAQGYADEALRLAQADVSGWSGPGGTSGFGWSGSGGIAGELGGMVLGGILSGAIREAGYRGGGFGGGGFGGGGIPGSFGGSASRGRRGGGGRF